MIGPQKVTTSGTQIPVFYGQYPETFIGGFTLDVTNMTAQLALAGLQVIPKGSVAVVNESTRRVIILKTASLQAAALNTDTILKFNKGHLFSVGDIVGYVAGGVGATISAIDSSNVAYDAVTISATLGVALAAFQAVFQSTTAGSTAAAPYATESVTGQTKFGLTLFDYSLVAQKDMTIVRGGAVYARRTNGCPAFVQAFMTKMTFSNSQ